ncbi:MAG: DUF4340 domain-containing protein [Deltaproteobacteria bacterium]|nr:DUF4340 domain-containing protein [Deltaproteobacteria bacterium]MBW2415787.1 DUF4340 domain-containing protein [Deltaproteobacteria bacterium]
MSLRATGVLVGVAVALGLWVWFGEIGGERGSGESAAVRLFPVEEDAVTALDVPLKGGGHARLVRSGTGWRLESPVDYAASQDEVADLLRSVTGLEAAGEIGDVGPDLSPFGLGGELAGGSERRVAVEAGAERFALRIGKPTPFGGNVYVALAGKDDVIFTAPQWKTDALERELHALRDARMISTLAADVTGVRIQVEGEPLLAARKLDDGWVLTEPFAEPADQDRLTRLIEDLDLARAVGFVDEPGPAEDYGLAPPKVVLELTTADDARERIEMGRAGDAQYLRIDGREQIWSIAPRILDGVPRSVFTLRDKQVLKLPESDATRVVLVFPRSDERYAFVRSDGSWAADGHELDVDPVHLEDLVYGLSDLDAVDIPPPGEDPAALGLEPPVVRVELYAEGGEELAWLELGDASGDASGGRAIGARSSQKDRLWRVAPETGADVPLGAEALRNTWLRAEDAQ